LGRKAGFYGGRKRVLRIVKKTKVRMGKKRVQRETLKKKIRLKKNTMRRRTIQRRNLGEASILNACFLTVFARGDACKDEHDVSQKNLGKKNAGERNKRGRGQGNREIDA